jgi:hypothetical protein
MVHSILIGMAIASGSGAAAYLGVQGRNYYSNYYVKEAFAAIEVVGHFFSYLFYADASFDALQYSINAELISRVNYKYLLSTPKEVNFYLSPSVNYIHLELDGTYLDKLSNNIASNTGVPEQLTNTLMPFIGALMLNKAKIFSASLNLDLFKSWSSISSLPDLMPGSKMVGLAAMAIFRANQDLYDWAHNPGGETDIGAVYRDYIVAPWEIIHKPYHFYEGTILVNQYLNNVHIEDASPLITHLIGDTSPTARYLDEIINEF